MLLLEHSVVKAVVAAGAVARVVVAAGAVAVAKVAAVADAYRVRDFYLSLWNPAGNYAGPDGEQHCANIEVSPQHKTDEGVSHGKLQQICDDGGNDNTSAQVR